MRPTMMSDKLHQMLGTPKAYGFPFSDAYARKVRGRVGKALPLFYDGAPLSVIPVDDVAFERRIAEILRTTGTPAWVKGDLGKIVSEIRTAMRHARGVAAQRAELRARRDVWTELVALGQAHGKKAERAFDVLAMEARETGATPADIDAIWFLDRIRAARDAAKGGRAEALRQAATQIERLHDLGVAAPGVLPPRVGPLPRVTTRRVTPPLTPRFAAALETFLKECRRGERRKSLRPKPERRERGAVKPISIEGYRKGVLWYYASLVARGLINPAIDDPDPGKFATPERFWEAIDEEIGPPETDEDEAEAAEDAPRRHPWTRLRPRSLRAYVKVTARFLARWDRTIVLDREEALLDAYFEDAKGMTPERRALCRRVVEDRALKRAFLRSARIFFDEAKALMARWDELSEPERAEASKLALAAAFAAVVTFLPLRVATALRLRLKASAAFQQNVFFSKTGPVVLSIPGKIVKNKRTFERVPLKARRDVDPREILQWWLKKDGPRAKLMERIDRADATLLFGGVGYDYMLDAWKIATDRIGLFMTIHPVRHVIASILINRPNADIRRIAALLGIKASTAQRTYAFFDTERATTEGMADLADSFEDAEPRLRRAA